VEIAYQTVDVFTDTHFGGNPLAVIPDARGLSATLMQRIAAEFNYSETTFVLPPARPDHTAAVRIFTPTTEVPFAGHPNVGTAYVLARQGTVFERPVGDEMRFEERAGVVAVEVLRAEGAVAGAGVSAPQPLSLGLEIPAGVVAACAGLDPADIALATHAPRQVSVGLQFAVAELASREALARARPNPAHFVAADRDFAGAEGVFALFLYVPLDAAQTTLAARMFAPLDNILEDPATGSASAALAAFRASLAPRPDGAQTTVILQGEDMGRPSRIEAVVETVAGRTTRVSVRGSCVPVMRGVLTVGRVG
jgi:trans-2,3-dihydro-3-hydroxyanthranilate isomerase